MNANPRRWIGASIGLAGKAVTLVMATTLSLAVATSACSLNTASRPPTGPTAGGSPTGPTIGGSPTGPTAGGSPTGPTAGGSPTGPTTSPATRIFQTQGPPPVCLSYPSSATLASGPEAQWPSAGYYDITPHGPYWSVVAGRGSQLGNTDVGLYGHPATACNQYTNSADAEWTHTDWIAFDNNAGRLPVATYTARFYTSPGSDFYQFVAGSKRLSTSEPTVDQPMGLGQCLVGNCPAGTEWLVDVRDVWLSAGSTYTFKIKGGFNAAYILHSNTAKSDTWTRTKATANPSVILPDTDPNVPQGVTTIVRTASLTFHPAVSAWFGFLVVRNLGIGKAVTVKVIVS
jgi:hypothetical protein